MEAFGITGIAKLRAHAPALPDDAERPGISRRMRKSNIRGVSRRDFQAQAHVKYRFLRLATAGALRQLRSVAALLLLTPVHIVCKRNCKG